MIRKFLTVLVFILPAALSSAEWIQMSGTILELSDKRGYDSKKLPDDINHGSVYVVVEIEEPIDLNGSKIKIILKESLTNDVIPNFWNSEAVAFELNSTRERMADPHFIYYDVPTSIRNIQKIDSNKSSQTIPAKRPLFQNDLNQINHQPTRRPN